jgi:trimeric autotransporter adhesin
LHQGAFVWADSQNAIFASTANDQFSARAAGGVRFFSNSGATLGAQLAPNATSWSALSDRNAKENIAPINVRDILEELVHMPITKWSYKDDPAQRRYIGPMAQDFHSAFGLGDDDKRINTLDSESVALAAIQGLNEIVKERDAHIAALEKRLDQMEKRLEQVSEQVEQSKAAPQLAANARNQGGM